MNRCRALRVGSFKVTQGSVSYEDRSHPSEFTARLQPINFELRDFTTGVQGGLFTFTGASSLGERIEWHGHLSVQPIESDGELRIDALRAHTIWEYLEDQLNFVINSGQIDLDATYKFSLKDTVDLQLNLAKLAAADIAVRPRDSELDLITIPRLTVLGTTVELAPRRAHVDSVSLTGVKIATWLEPDGSFNLLKLMGARVASAKAQATTGAGPGAAVAASPAAAASPPPPRRLHPPPRARPGKSNCMNSTSPMRTSRPRIGPLARPPRSCWRPCRCTSRGRASIWRSR